MANRYWVNGTGNWSSTAQWSLNPGGTSGASVPVLTDDVIFDRAATYSVTLDAATRNCNNITVSAGTVTFVYTNILNIYGSLSYIAGVIHSGAASSTFRSTSTGQTITSNGTTFGNGIIFTGDGGEWTLGSSLTGGTCSVQAGTLTLNGFTLTSSTVGISNTFNKRINFGAANWVMSSSPMSCNTVTGFSWTGTGGIATAMTINKTFSFGGLSGADSTNAINLTLTSGAFAANIVPGSWFNTFDTSASTGIINGIFATTARDTALNLNSVITSSRGISGILTMKGAGNVNYIATSCLGMVIDHTTPGITTLLAPLTVSNGTALGTLSLLSGNINLNGQAVACRNFQSTGTGTRAIAFGSSLITINGSGGAIVDYLNVPNATNFTVSGTGGFTTTMAVIRGFNFGATAGGTSNNAPNLSLTSGAAIPTFATGSWFKLLDFTGTTSVPVGSLSTVTSLNLSSLTLASGGTYTKVAATMRDTGIITGSSKAIEALTINHTGTTTFASALSCTTYTQTAGNVNFATFNLTGSGAAAYTAGTLSNIGTIACTTWTIGTGSTFTMSSGTISASTSFTLTSGAFNYNSSNGVITTPSFVHTAGTVTLGATLAFSATCTYTFSNGTLNLAGFTLTTGIFSSSSTGTRAIAFGAGNIVLAHTSIAQTVLSMAIATGFSYTGTGGFTSAMSVTRTFVFGTTGGSTTNAPNLSLTSGASQPSFTASSWFNLLDFTGQTGSIPSTRVNVNSLKLGGGGYGALDVVMVGTGNITSVGKSLANITISHTGVTTLLDAFTQGVDQTPLYMQTGTLDLGGFTCTISIFNNFGTGTRAIAFGSTNIVLARSTAGVVINSSVVTNFSWTGTGGFTTAMTFDRSFGFNNSSYVVVDNAPNLSLTSGAGIPSFNNVNRGSWFKNLDFTGSTSTVAGDANSSRLTVYVQGLTLASGGNYDKLRPSMYGTGTINTAGNSTLGGLIIDHVDNSDTITTLTSAVTLPTTSNTTLTSGTLNLGGNNLSTGDFISTGSGTRAIAFNTSNIILTFPSGVVTVLNMADATNFSTTGAGGFTSSAAAATKYYNFGSTSGGTANNAPNLSITSGGSPSGFVINSYFNHLNFTGSTTVPRDSLSVSAFAVNLKALTLASGVSYTYLTPTIFGGGGAINSAGNSTLPSLTINHSSGSVGNTTLAANLTLATNATTTLTSGNLVLAGFTLDNGIFSSSGSTSRAIHFSTGNIALTHTTGSTTVLSMQNAAGFTATGTGGFTSAMSVARTFNFGTSSLGSYSNGIVAPSAPNLTLTSGASAPTFPSGSWVKALDFTGTTCTPVATKLYVDTLTLATGGTYTSFIPFFTRTQTLTPQFSKQLGGFGISSPGDSNAYPPNISSTITVTLGSVPSIVATGTTTLETGILDLNGYDLTTGIFSSSGIFPRRIAFGANNISLAHTNTFNTVLSMADATYFTWSGTGGFTSAMSVDRTFDFGSTLSADPSYTGSPNLTFGIDSATYLTSPNLSLTAGSGTPTFTYVDTGSWFNLLNFTGSTGTPVGKTNVNSLTLASGGTYTSLQPTMVGTGTITSSGKTLSSLNFDSGYSLAIGTTTLNGNISVAGTTDIRGGVIALAGYTLTTDQFTSGGDFTGLVRTIVGGGGAITVTGSAWTNSYSTNWASSNYTINMNSAASKVFTGSGGTYGIINQGGAGALTISGSNYFEAMTATTKPSSVIFTAGTTQYISTTTFFSGSAGALITLTSTTPTSAFTVSKASGTINSDYLNLTDSIATGGATWNAGTHSIDTARNTGWVFTGGAPVYAVGGQFLAFFA